MPVDGISGIPGHGKTSLLMEELVADVERNNKHEKSGETQLVVNGVNLITRPLYASGIDGLQDGLVMLLADPRTWNDVDFSKPGECDCDSGTVQVLLHEGLRRYVTDKVETEQWKAAFQVGRPHAHVIPDGSKIFVDEAWKWFGHQDDARGAKPPEYVTAMAEHRHRSLDFVMTFQSPKQIYPFLRPLMGPHRHVVRRFGTALIDVYKWGELVDEVQSQGTRDRATKETRTLPTKQRTLWKSASGHTIKPKIPVRMIAAAAGVLLALPLLYFAIQSMRPSAIAKGVTGKGQDASLLASGQPATDQATATGKPELTIAEWKARLTPRIPGVHGSQPVFDGREVQTTPATYCMISGSGRGSRCRCVTEQGTTISDILPSVCRHDARWGRYDPFRGAPEPSRQAVAFEPDTPEPLQDGPQFGRPAGGSPLDVASPSMGLVQGK